MTTVCLVIISHNPEQMSLPSDRENLLAHLDNVLEGLRQRTTEFANAIVEASANSRTLLDSLMFEIITYPVYPMPFWPTFDNMITERLHNEAQLEVVRLYKNTFANAILVFLEPHLALLQESLQHSQPLEAELREFLSTSSKEKRADLKNWPTFLTKNKLFSTVAHRLPFNLPVVFDLMAVLADDSRVDVRLLHTACQNCEAVQLALMYVAEFCDAQVFVQKWRETRAKWSNTMLPEEMFFFIYNHNTRVIEYKNWCDGLSRCSSQGQNLADATVDAIRKEYLDTLFANLGVIGDDLERLQGALPSPAFEKLIPSHPELTTRFRFVDEPSECLICLEPILAGISPCTNNACGLNSNFGGTRQYCHYRCFRSHAWSFQYDLNDAREEQRPVRCMLCNSSFEVQEANLTLTQFLPTGCDITAPETDIGTCYSGGTFSTSKMGHFVEETDSNRKISPTEALDSAYHF